MPYRSIAEKNINKVPLKLRIFRNKYLLFIYSFLQVALFFSCVSGLIAIAYFINSLSIPDNISSFLQKNYPYGLGILFFSFISLITFWSNEEKALSLEKSFSKENDFKSK